MLYGCEGTDVWLLLLSALAVTPGASAWRASGILVGTVVVYLLNQARILGLFLTLQSHSPWFGMLHGTIAPLLIVCLVLIFFLAWTGLALHPGFAQRVTP